MQSSAAGRRGVRRARAPGSASRRTGCRCPRDDAQGPAAAAPVTAPSNASSAPTPRNAPSWSRSSPTAATRQAAAPPGKRAGSRQGTRSAGRKPARRADPRPPLAGLRPGGARRPRPGPRVGRVLLRDPAVTRYPWSKTPRPIWAFWTGPSCSSGWRAGPVRARAGGLPGADPGQPGRGGGGAHGRRGRGGGAAAGGRDPAGAELPGGRAAPRRRREGRARCRPRS